ncbi:DNA cytosine methyltransferase [bacterium]|nr:DNA cytosine methyltransferase [bacterium]
MLTFGELFAGIGGFSLGLERAGMQCKWQVEIDPYAQAVLKKHWPEVPKHDDVRTFPPQGDWGVDLICGGFPCQDISVAGKGAGLEGARSGLWHEFARIVGELRPRYVVVENVAALLTRGMGTVLGDLSSLRYDAEWHVIPASAVGAPHRRERVWLVCFRNRIGSEADASRSDSDCLGPHRARIDINREAQLRHEQVGVSGQMGADVADAERERIRVRGHSGLVGQAGTLQAEEQERQRIWPDAEPSREGGDVADADQPGLERHDDGACAAVKAGTITANTRTGTICNGSNQWSTEPDVGRVANGVPSRVDRLRCLGNAVVPQVVEIIGRAIVEHAERNAAQRS